MSTSHFDPELGSSRRASLDSFDSASEHSSLDSTTALVLIHDPDEAVEESPFDVSGDEEEEDDLGGAAAPALPPATVFLYLLSPYLKLGALLVPSHTLPLDWAVPTLVGFAVLSAFTRQVWFMLARYVRKAEMEDVVCDAFARGGGKEGRRRVIRALVRLATGVTRGLLAVVYLRASVDMLIPLTSPSFGLRRVGLTAALGVVTFPLAWAKSLAFRRVVYSTWLSVGAYVVWMGLETYAQVRGADTVDPSPRMGSLWQGITTIAFAFSTTTTLPLYASLKGTPRSITTASKHSLSFTLLSLLSVAVATGVMLPLVIAASSSNLQASDFPSTYVMAILKVVVLVSSIPALVITSPAVPMPLGMRRVSDVPFSKIIALLMVGLLSLVPEKAAYVMEDVLLVLMLLNALASPALVHIVTYQFKRPLSIVMPHTPALHRHRSSDSAFSHDELLQRKERTLQRRRLWRRVAWDVGVWVVLLPISGGGFTWAGGRILGAW
ncbi:hypothetical protein OE88DRAFT_1628061 [Heliocybe sulcata]|uniref:Amino acid transporter transmembrane domain-containing protein n=1 Tax=Heliocybe sulcata TaxID=5364 RepID=A0A5C3N3C6_9AGAM|nr:hypothetical protein OE88DRAFT_1628061 [Heliocybe sulcata]